MDNISACIEALSAGNLEKAYQLMDIIQKTGSDEEKEAFAYELFDLGFLQEAEKLVKDLLENFPDEGELLILLAEIYVNDDKINDALLVLDKITMADLVYPQALVLQAELYEREALFEVSEKKLLEAEKLLPTEPVIQFALAELYFSIGKLHEAVYKYEQVLKTEDEIAGINIHERLANVYSAAGEFEKALPYYEQAEVAKLTVDVLFGHGLTAFQAGYHEAAVEKFIEVTQLDPDFESVYLYLAKAYEHQDLIEEGFESVKAGLSVNPFQKELYFLGGKLATKLGKVNEAKEMLNKALNLDPSYVEAIMTLNQISFTENDYAEVMERTIPALEEGEEDPYLLWDLAIACEKEERYLESLNYYRQAYNFFKTNEEFLQNYGFFLLEEGNIGESIEVFKQLQKMNPANLEYADVLERLSESL